MLATRAAANTGAGPMSGIESYDINNLTPDPVVLLTPFEHGSIHGCIDTEGGRAYTTFSLVVEIPSVGNAYATRFVHVDGLQISGTNIPVVVRSHGRVLDLPDPSDGRLYIVTEEIVTAARKNGRTTNDLLLLSRPVTDLVTGATLGYTEFVRG